MNGTLESTLHWIYVFVMASGVLYFWLLSRDPRGVPRREYLVALMIPLVSGLAYMAMAFGYGTVEIAGQTTYFARYLDWTVTTPLLLLALAWTAMLRVRKDTTLIAALLGTDVFMIVCGLIADLTTGPARVVFFLTGTVAFLVILWLIWSPLRAVARTQGPDLARVFDRVAGLLTVLWVLYPTLWILGPSGFGILSQTAETAGFVITPILSKVGWSIVDLHSLRALPSDGTNGRAAVN